MSDQQPPHDQLPATRSPRWGRRKGETPPVTQPKGPGDTLLPPADMDESPQVDATILADRVDEVERQKVALPVASSIGKDASTAIELNRAIADCDMLLDFCSRAIDKIDKRVKFPWLWVITTAITFVGGATIGKAINRNLALVIFTAYVVLLGIALTGHVLEKRKKQPFMNSTQQQRNTLVAQAAAYTRRRIELNLQLTLLKEDSTTGPGDQTGPSHDA